MAENTRPVTPNDRKPVDPPAPKVVDYVANAKKIKDEWTNLKKGDSRGRAHIPGTRRSVEMSHVEIDSNKVSVWTTSDKRLSPDFVIVNPPVDLEGPNGTLIEDPLTVIAIVIDGATQ